mmetsp:Transcript_8864/g.16132  ORF Transcript_8864/g.16132 Transcript_8864/m.16132 type:complete len:317 (+) Transcript_8864:468-1418(+)
MASRACRGRPRSRTTRTLSSWSRRSRAVWWRSELPAITLSPRPNSSPGPSSSMRACPVTAATFTAFNTSLTFPTTPVPWKPSRSSFTTSSTLASTADSPNANPTFSTASLKTTTNACGPHRASPSPSLLAKLTPRRIYFWPLWPMSLAMISVARWSWRREKMSFCRPSWRCGCSVRCSRWPNWPKWPPLLSIPFPFACPMPTEIVHPSNSFGDSNTRTKCLGLACRNRIWWRRFNGPSMWPTGTSETFVPPTVPGSWTIHGIYFPRPTCPSETPLSTQWATSSLPSRKWKASFPSWTHLVSTMHSEESPTLSHSPS